MKIKILLLLSMLMVSCGPSLQTNVWGTHKAVVDIQNTRISALDCSSCNPVEPCNSLKEAYQRLSVSSSTVEKDPKVKSLDLYIDNFSTFRQKVESVDCNYCASITTQCTKSKGLIPTLQTHVEELRTNVDSQAKWTEIFNGMKNGALKKESTDG